MAGPFEVVARDGQYAKTKGGSEKDMWQAWQCAKAGEDAKALEIINAYAGTLQRFEGHDAPLCLIQAYWMLRGMIILKDRQTPAWSEMVRRAILPVIDRFEAYSPYANGNWGHIVNRCRMACGIFLGDKELYMWPRAASARRRDATRATRSWAWGRCARSARWPGSRATTSGAPWTTA